MVKKSSVMNINNVLISSVSIIYVAYLTFRRQYFIMLLVGGVFAVLYTLTKNNLNSLLVAIVVALCAEILLSSYEKWTVYTGTTDIRTGGNHMDEFEKYPFPETRIAPCSVSANETECGSAAGCVWLNDDNHNLDSTFNNKCIDGDILTHDSDGNVEEPYELKVVEGFTGKQTNKKRQRKQKKKIQQKKKKETFDEDDDEVNESYIDLGSSFLEAYQSLTPKQIEKMSVDTKNLMSHQKRLIETLDNLGPVIKGGKRVMEQFKHYFNDEI